jgi:SWIM zinc finger
MDARQEKDWLLSKDKRIKRVEGALWFVPSQSRSAGGYLVNALASSCSCPNRETRRVRCRHVIAVEMMQTVEVTPDGSASVTESVKVTRKTYTQKWPVYNPAQCVEKATAQALLRSLCDGIVTPPHPWRGPKPFPLADAVFGMTVKLYTTISGTRATTDIEACADAGHMTKAPGYNTIFDAFGKVEMIALLTALVEESAAPPAAVESKFAVDSSGLGTVT